MKVTLEIELPPEVIQSVGLQLGKLPDELTAMEAQAYLTQKLMEHCRDVMTRKTASTMTNQEVRRRVYHLIFEPMHRGPVPIYGKTDRELMEAMPGLQAPTVRWARYDLLKRGYVKHDGRRGTGKVWKVTGKPIPNELRVLPVGLIEASEEPV